VLWFSCVVDLVVGPYSSFPAVTWRALVEQLSGAGGDMDGVPVAVPADAAANADAAADAAAVAEPASLVPLSLVPLSLRRLQVVHRNAALLTIDCLQLSREQLALLRFQVVFVCEPLPAE
jgi:hypothetical protein